MIFFMAGTSDARDLALAIQDAGYPLLTSVVTEHAANALKAVELQVRVGRLDIAEMMALLKEKGATLLVDASHPFAEEAHLTAMAAANACGVTYLRYERSSQTFRDHASLLHVDTYEEAAQLAAQKKGNVMLTTGSKTLPIFTAKLVGDPEVRLVARMLPRVDNMEKCVQLGVGQENIIAMQGPFSRDLNEALYRHYGTTLMITKESGGPGAVDEKVEAALAMGIEVIVIGRPKLDFAVSFSTVDALLSEIARRIGLTHSEEDERSERS
ncbi:precorrin-6A reductase [Ferroacidibacillus organovorans]|uniref:Precorrin-6x reductase n=1 Tax=Ferroacidibacillus organovorans TaxID=1765683 RepID=A0A853KDV0_9BACL|nr:precorrin-6A reductase [Ferroacidibacillus organovorans]KYP79464.1 precorrin-6x reductase [Ferroacidibacillus organovorans]OAG94518.1 precorrin-6x reductase [Ferroacidibacillus organovorans]